MVFCLVAGYTDFLHHSIQTSSLWGLCFPALGSRGWVGHCFGLHHLDSCVCRSHAVGAPWFNSAGDISLIFTPHTVITVNTFRDENQSIVRNENQSIVRNGNQTIVRNENQTIVRNKIKPLYFMFSRSWSCPSHQEHWVKSQRQHTMSEEGFLEIWA